MHLAVYTVGSLVRTSWQIHGWSSLPLRSSHEPVWYKHLQVSHTSHADYAEVRQYASAPDADNVELRFRTASHKSSAAIRSFPSSKIFTFSGRFSLHHWRRLSLRSATAVISISGTFPSIRFFAWPEPMLPIPIIPSLTFSSETPPIAF